MDIMRTCRREFLIHVYDTATGQIISEGALEGRPRVCHGAMIVISPDGKWVAVATDVSEEIYLWNVSSGKVVGRFCGHTSITHAMRFSPASDRLYSGSYDGTLREWSVDTLAQLRVVD